MANSETSPQAWHALEPTEVARLLGSDTTAGLTAAVAAERLAADGPNTLAEAPAVPWWARLMRQFQEIVIGILLVAAIIAGVLGEWADTAAILAIVLINGVIGFLQEERAQQALGALRRLAAPLARAVRDGQPISLPARELVVGDVVVLEAGDHVPADARLVEASGLTAQEAALTGESVPVAKDARAKLPDTLPLGDRATLVHTGTVIASGHGKALVVATGMETELGDIAGLLESAPPEITPLQRRLGELGRVLIVVCLAIVALISVLELLRGGSPGDVLLRSVSLAVAAVPEGLPAVVTLVLALGLQRMVARNALVRRLPSVETLGCVTVIGSDKTGTLTRNEMTVRTVVAGRREYRVSGAGYAPHGEFFMEQAGSPAGTCDPTADAGLTRLLTIGARCNNAALRPAADGDDRWQVIGDPTEGALLVAALKAGIGPDDATEQVVYELPFDSDRKTMSVVARRPDGRFVVYTKGAPESVLERCTYEDVGAGPEPLSRARRSDILALNARLAGRALRVLALAWQPQATWPEAGLMDEKLERELVFVGLVGMIDPPREEARAAVATCTVAGIRPIMITGDHPATALAIARELGIARTEDRVATGAELDGWSLEELAARVGEIAVYARVTAEHKLRIVQAWQRRGDVVAMTGDGVNDAPAIRAADIGIAMGLTGTDVTKEASDMVLTDDNFASIVSAVEEGRGIYDNIQKFIHYLLACNAGEVVVMLVAAVVGWPAPLAAIQILWLNIITDGLPALALGLEPPETDLMQRRPRAPREPVISWSRGSMIVSHGAIMAAVVLVAFWVAYRGDATRIPHARTIAFCVTAFAQLLFAFACRSDAHTVWHLGIASNPALLVAVAVSALLQASVVMLPFAQPVFEVGAGLGADWALVLTAACVPIAIVEGLKCVVGDGARRGGDG